jgi:hypothetical protein
MGWTCSSDRRDCIQTLGGEMFWKSPTWRSWGLDDNLELNLIETDCERVRL